MDECCYYSDVLLPSGCKKPATWRTVANKVPVCEEHRLFTEDREPIERLPGTVPGDAKR